METKFEEHHCDENDSEEDEIVIKDFDDVFDFIGGWGPFQYLITLAFFPFNIFLGYVYLSPILTLYTPPHWCAVPSLSHLTVEERKDLAIPRNVQGGFSECSQYLVDWNQTNLSGQETWSVGPCSAGWEYDTENYHRSIVSDMNWVCEDAWVPAMSQSIFFLGAVPGMLFFGWFCDHYGRLPTIIIANLIALVTGVATPFVTERISFFVLRFLMGLSFNTFFTVPYTLAVEYVGKTKRTLVGNLGLAICLTLSGCYQPWLAKWLSDWRLFNWLLFSQLGLVVFLPIVMPESCRFGNVLAF